MKNIGQLTFVPSPKKVLKSSRQLGANTSQFSKKKNLFFRNVAILSGVRWSFPEIDIVSYLKVINISIITHPTLAKPITLWHTSIVNPLSSVRKYFHSRNKHQQRNAEVFCLFNEQYNMVAWPRREIEGYNLWHKHEEDNNNNNNNKTTLATNVSFIQHPLLQFCNISFGLQYVGMLQTTCLQPCNTIGLEQKLVATFVLHLILIWHLIFSLSLSPKLHYKF